MTDKLWFIINIIVIIMFVLNYVCQNIFVIRKSGEVLKHQGLIGKERVNKQKLGKLNLKFSNSIKF